MVKGWVSGKGLKVDYPEGGDPESATVRDLLGVPLVNRTLRDRESTSESGRQGSYQRVRLPPELAARFEIVSELPRGGEADVLLVTDLNSQEFRVLKLYGQSTALDESAMDLLATANPEHVVIIYEWGKVDRIWYEVQEHCALGTLRELLSRQGSHKLQQDMLEPIVSEVSTALTHLHHDLSITHRDIKPENIFVRREQPLDLVLGDFGIARAMSSSIKFTKAWGTPAYWPPESGGGQVSEVSPAWDWWSLGMIVAEIGEGRHPLATLLATPQLIPSYLAQHSIPLDEIEDPRVRSLTQGLLLRNRSARWSGTQVERWLAGESPVIESEATSAAVRRVHFLGNDYTSSVALANAFQSHWVAARQNLFQVREAMLVDETKALCRSENLTEAILILDQPSNTGDVARSFARLLVEMNPRLPPLYNGVDLTRQGLLIAADEAISQSGQGIIADVLEEVELLQVLLLWRSLEGVDHGPSTQANWHSKVLEYRRLREALSTNRVELSVSEDRAAMVWLLRCTLQAEESNAALQELLASKETTHAEDSTWWSELASPISDEVAIVLALMTHAQAVQQEAAKAEQVRITNEAAERSKMLHQELQKRWGLYVTEMSRLSPSARSIKPPLNAFRAWRHAVFLLFLPSLWLTGVLTGDIHFGSWLENPLSAQPRDYFGGLLISGVLAWAVTLFRVDQRRKNLDSAQRVEALKVPKTGCGQSACELEPCRTIRTFGYIPERRFP